MKLTPRPDGGAGNGEARHLDPVCRMLVAEGREAGSLRHGGTLYRFCSLDCAELFLRDPDAYAR